MFYSLYPQDDSVIMPLFQPRTHRYWYHIRPKIDTTKPECSTSLKSMMCCLGTNTDLCKMQRIKVPIFDDNKPRQELLTFLMKGTKGIVCTGIYEDCCNIIKNLADDVPDIILMDIDMPNVNGIKGMKLVKQHYPQIKVMMQTVFEDDEKTFDAILSGADGYILKKTSPAKLMEAITEIMNGGAPMTPSVARQVLTLIKKKPENEKVHFNLTERELEILGLLVKGMSYKMIAARCNISFTTVNSHIRHIYEKLHVNSGTEAVAKAIEHRIV